MAVLLVGVAMGAWAQDAAPAGPPPDNGPMQNLPGRGGPLGPEWMDRDAREVVEAVMIARLSKQLNLNDEQTVLMMRRFDEMKGQIDEMKEKRMQLVRDLEEKVNSGAADDTIEQALKQLVECDKAMATLRADVTERAGEGLAVRQRAKLYLIAGDFENDMRRLVNHARVRAAYGKGGLRGGPVSADEAGPDAALDGPPQKQGLGPQVGRGGRGLRVQEPRPNDPQKPGPGTSVTPPVAP